MSTAKSEWVGISCHTESGRDAVKSWFGGFADNMEGPTQAKMLTRIEDEKCLKLSALFTEGGEQKEVTRTMGRNVTIAISPPSPRRWR